MALVSETERLSLRRLTLDDARLMLAIWNDPAFLRHVGDRGIRTPAQARDAMRDGPLRLYEEYGYGPYRLALNTDDTAIGICGLFRRDGFETPDLGYAILPAYCRQGFAYEAASAVIEYARSTLRIPDLIAIIAPGNQASIRLIEKLGFSFVERRPAPDDGGDVCIYGRQLQQQAGAAWNS